MILLALGLAHAAEFAVWTASPPPGSVPALGPSAAILEARTGIPLTGWVRVDASRLPPGSLAVRLDQPPVPPPFERLDYDPETPSFASDWLDPAPVGFGSRKLWAWPGGTGEYAVIADIEYDFDPLHEDLRANPPLGVVGEPQGEWSFHGNGCLGIAAGAADGFGLTGAAPDAVLLVAHPKVDGSYQPARAIADAALWLEAGDVLLIEQQTFADGNYAPMSTNPMAADAMAAATALGILVVEPMGNGSQDATDLVLGEPGSLRVGSLDPTTGAAHLSSNYGTIADIAGWGSQIPSPTTSEYSPDLFFPNQDERQAYTSFFGGTSGASAQLAGVVAQLQSISEAVHAQALPTDVIREGLRETGVPQADGFRPAAETPVGPAPDAQAFARTFLVP